MEQYVIKGGNPLKGTVNISGAKNAALPIIAAATMGSEPVIIENLPNVSDINVLLDGIKEMGAEVKRLDEHTVSINGGTINNLVLDTDLIRRIRASYYLLGSMLGKYKKGTVALPGGCNIGSRPIDLHLKGFRILGAKDCIKDGLIKVEADKLLGDKIYLDIVSVGATINIMMAAVMAEGKTVIENAAKEPHIVDVANLLNKMGANIRGAGTSTIRVNGVKALYGTTYNVIPDQIEAGTFMVAAAITNGDVTVNNVIPVHLESISSKLKDMGCTIIEGDESIRVIGNNNLKATHIMTLPYPGFPTDMQSQMSAALVLAKGTSIVTESIFENRFQTLNELNKMGANTIIKNNVGIIEGVDNLFGARVMAPDLRGGAALVLAGLSAKGITIIEDIKYIKRGYEDFPSKLRKLGGIIEEVAKERDIKKFILKTS